MSIGIGSIRRVRKSGKSLSEMQQVERQATAAINPVMAMKCHEIIGKVMRQTTVYQRLLPLLRSFGKSNGSDIIIYVYDVYAYTYIYKHELHNKLYIHTDNLCILCIYTDNWVLTMVAH